MGWGKKGVEGGGRSWQRHVLRGTSGTPPTAVDTTMSPAAAASTIAMQKASVSDAFMKISPLTCSMQTEAILTNLSHTHLFCLAHFFAVFSLLQQT